VQAQLAAAWKVPHTSLATALAEGRRTARATGK
jgi:hypothetical protein